MFTKPDLIQLKRKLVRQTADTYGGTTTINEMAVINHVYECWAGHDNCTVTEAALALRLSKSTVSRIMGDLRARGIVEEQYEEDDRRRRFFAPTENFIRLKEQNLDALSRWLNEDRTADKLAEDTVRLLCLRLPDKLKLK